MGKKKKGLSASESPGVSAQVSSPIQVLTGPGPAELPRSDTIRCVQGGMALDSSKFSYIKTVLGCGGWWGGNLGVCIYLWQAILMHSQLWEPLESRSSNQCFPVSFTLAWWLDITSYIMLIITLRSYSKWCLNVLRLGFDPDSILIWRVYCHHYCCLQ